MAKNCPNCGTVLDDNAAFCGNCGTNLNMNQNANQNANQNNANPNMNQNMNQGMNQNMPMNQGYQQNYGGVRPTLQKKEIVTAIILSLVTCGIYSIIWFIQLTDDANLVSGDNKTSGGMAFLLTFVTCGIYGIYWYYKQGQKIYQAEQRAGMQATDNSVLYLILGIVGFGIVSYCLMQSELNKFAQ